MNMTNMAGPYRMPVANHDQSPGLCEKAAPPNCLGEAVHLISQTHGQILGELANIFAALEGPIPTAGVGKDVGSPAGMISKSNDNLTAARMIFGQVSRVREMLTGPR